MNYLELKKLENGNWGLTNPKGEVFAESNEQKLLVDFMQKVLNS